MSEALFSRIGELTRSARMLPIAGAALKLRSATDVDPAIRVQVDDGLRLVFGETAAELEKADSAQRLPLIDMAHAAGVKFLCSTLTPFHGTPQWTAAAETTRAGLHAFMRSAASGCDAIVDQAAVTGARSPQPAAPRSVTWAITYTPTITACRPSPTRSR